MYLEIRGLNKSFGNKTVVKDLDLDLARGEILCLLGSSGCGKTTTLRMIAGFLAADSGSIRIDGEEISGLAPESRPVSTVFQSYALFPNMSVLGNVMYGLKFKGMGKTEARERARTQLALVGLSEYENASVNEISGGQQQRVALARALSVEPKILLLDEPLSNLDAKLRIRMREELSELQKRLGMTMIFVTHDQEEAMVLADRIAIMNEGRLVQVGAPREVYEKPKDPFAMHFLGTANEIHLPDGSCFYLRPEHIRICGPVETETMQEKPESGDTGFAGQNAQESPGTAGEAALRQGVSGKAQDDPAGGRQLFVNAVVQTAEYLGFYMQYTVQTETGDRLTLRVFDRPVYETGAALRLSFFPGDALM